MDIFVFAIIALAMFGVVVAGSVASEGSVSVMDLIVLFVFLSALLVGLLGH